MTASVITPSPVQNLSSGHHFIELSLSSSPLLNSPLGSQHRVATSPPKILRSVPQQHILGALNMPPPLHPPILPLSYNDSICHQLYNEGLFKGCFSDVTLHVPFKVKQFYKVHSVIIAQSPRLLQLLENSPNPTEITIDVDDPNVNEEGFSIAIGHLYANSIPLITPRNARSVFASAFLLGLDQLCFYIVEIIKKNITKTTILNYIDLIEQGVEYNGFSKDIRDACFLFLVRKLPKIFEAFKSDSSHERAGHQANRCTIELSNGTCHSKGYWELLKVFAELPFSWLKRVITSKYFEVPCFMRYKFAIDVVQERRELKKSNYEEMVYLAFGMKFPDHITIARKVPKSLRKTPTRVLYKTPVEAM
ncbi:hypothetical protein G9A89_019019 [Geosiphon pyriformis]|nr:hypothetical protein G9A89_019019 [Geosiphon pyriformis]